QDVRPYRPSARDGILSHKFRPAGARSYARIDRSDQFDVRRVVEADDGHLSNAVAVGTAEVWSHAHICEGLAKRVKIRSADRYVVKLQRHGLAFLGHCRLAH